MYACMWYRYMIRLHDENGIVSRDRVACCYLMVCYHFIPGTV